MARAKIDKPFSNFIGGLITEATGLSYPENSCRDLDNVDIYLSGMIRRRMGLTREPGGELRAPGSFPPDALYGPTQNRLAVTIHEWNGVGGKGNLNFIVVQMGRRLVVMNRDLDPVTQSSPGVTKIGNPHLFIGHLVYPPAASELGQIMAGDTLPLQSASGLGRLWMTGAAYRPFYLEYDDASEGIEIRAVGSTERNGVTYNANGRLAMRDFRGVEDGLNAKDEPNDLSQDHLYNLVNQGWTPWHINRFKEVLGVYPSNSQVWFFAKDSAGQYDPNEIRKNVFSAPAAKGSVLLGALNSQVLNPEVFSGAGSGVTGVQCFSLFGGGNTFCIPMEGDGSVSLPTPTLVDTQGEAVRSFQSTAFFAGRLWLGGEVNPVRGSSVYFSQVLDTPDKAGNFHSENDPTNEHFPDVLESDGGVIPMPDVDRILKLVPAGIGLLVIASNGVWFIRGGDSGFSATSFSVDRISTVGATSASAVIDYENRVLYWSAGGVYEVKFNSGYATISESITDETIRTYFQKIPLEAKQHAQGFVDELGKRMIWLWLDRETYIYPDEQSKRNRALILDMRTGSWTTYSLPESTEDGRAIYLAGGFAKKNAGLPGQLSALTTNDGTVITSNDLTPMVEYEYHPYFDSTSNVKMVTIHNLISMSVMEFSSLTFRDFYGDVTEPLDYTSFITTAPQNFGDLQRVKATRYIHSYFRRTETGFESTPGGLVALTPSACTVQAQWDWHNTLAGGRWSDPQRAYVPSRRPYAPITPADPYDTGEELTYSKLKLRGRGRVFSLRYQSAPGKDFQLAGFSLDVTSNGD